MVRVGVYFRLLSFNGDPVQKAFSSNPSQILKARLRDLNMCSQNVSLLSIKIVLKKASHIVHYLVGYENFNHPCVGLYMVMIYSENPEGNYS